MRLFNMLLITVSIILAVLGAATAYTPSLSAADDQLVGRELSANVMGVDEAGKPDVIVKGKTGVDEDGVNIYTTLDEPLITSLREKGVRRVRVTDFRFSTWTGKWMFLIGIGGMIAASLVTRRIRSMSAQAIRDTPPAEGAKHATPKSLIAAARTAVQKLRDDWSPNANRDELPDVVAALGEVQKQHLDAFVAMRPRLETQLGLAGYAQVMDRFAAAERQINRAWSAAADEVPDEVRICLDRAVPLLDETLAKLG